MTERSVTPRRPTARYSEPGESRTDVVPDGEARRRIRKNLERNFLVEAGAGSGKTKSLVDRMVALVSSGACQVEDIAAVTFTRMAAAELRQRFQEELEKKIECAHKRSQADDRKRLERALRNIHQAFLGTIHAFCARLLRERLVEAGLAPDFRELEETEAERSKQVFWNDFLEKLAVNEDPVLLKLKRLGIRPSTLQGAFGSLVENPDVDFVAERVERPDPDDVAALRAEFDALLYRAEVMMEGLQPKEGWKSLGQGFRTALYWHRSPNWKDPAVFFEVVAKFHRIREKETGKILTLKRWARTRSGQKEAKKLAEDSQAFGCKADKLLRQWWAYRYPVAVDLAGRAAEEYAYERKARGEVTFDDLLVFSTELLRKNDEARRDLGRRYPRILVDEFQDTDPLQAEILLLLSSDPESGDDWRRVTPRPGSLFVVGDPKQSIYRFRRADISLYEMVKRRFKKFGEVLRLEANFRSLPDFEKLVEGVFNDGQHFPSASSDRQASFAPLRAQMQGRGLLAAYRVQGANQDDVAEDDAARIASEISRRVRSGERRPGAFMILTGRRKFLSVYVRALERRNLPVEVSGAGVGFEDESRAFLTLFRCLADPQHEVHVLSVLTGPFFGMTLDRIVRYRDSGGSLVADCRPEGDCEVAEAIGSLHRWWCLARREPADITAERLVEKIGLFPLAAAAPLGGMRAGTLAYLLDAVRDRARAGDSSLAGAVDAMETALENKEAEPSLIPTQPDCVRVLNLHRAKGLEADVVFLAAPFGASDPDPRMHVSRREKGSPEGHLAVGLKVRFSWETIAQPLDWEEKKRKEVEFAKAEQIRLLYVAATRARHELWIACRPAEMSWQSRPSPWADVEEWVVERAGKDREADSSCHCVVLDELPKDCVPKPARLEPGEGLTGRIRAAKAGVRRSRKATYAVEKVTDLAKQNRPEGEVNVSTEPREADTDDKAHAPLDPGTRGREWGTVVHEVLAEAGEGVEREALEAFARARLVERERPLDRTGAPTELAALLDLVERVREMDIWKRAMASKERHTEMPFAVHRPRPDGGPGVLEGVIDLVFREGDHWVVADYKTDRGDDPGFLARTGRHRAQVDLYAECWEQLTGEVVGERALVYTSQGRTSTW